MTKADLQKKWASIILAYRSSGQTQAAFCKSAGISTRQLSYWLKKEKSNKTNTTQSPRWIPVEVEHKTHASEDQSILIRIGSAEVEVKPGFDQKHLLNVLTVLRALC